MKLSTLPEWLDWINQYHSQAIELGLDRLKKIIKKLELHNFSSLVITVGGSNGKGSTVASLESIYLEAGYHVGVFNSPILEKHNEYVRLDKQDVSDELFCDAYARIEQVKDGVKLTVFEYHCLAALIILSDFGKKYGDKSIVLLEVGLGGRLDAVNVIDADVAVVTNVSLDHCQFLGNDVESIAFEKAGIYRQNKPAIFADQPVPDSLNHYAQKIGANFLCLGKDYHYQITQNTWQFVMHDVSLEALPLPKINIKNAAAAIAAIFALQDRRAVAPAAISAGLKKISLSARQEIISKSPLEIHDVAHNVASVASLNQFLTQQGGDGKKIAVFSMLADKDILSCIKEIQKSIDEWYVAPLQTARAADMQTLQQAFASLQIKKVFYFDQITCAYQQAKKNLKKEDVLVVFGSFHTISGVKK